MQHAHLSALYRRTPEELDWSVTNLLRVAEISTLTEVGRDGRAAVLDDHPGAKLLQIEDGEGPPGCDECAALVEGMETRGPWANVLSPRHASGYGPTVALTFDVWDNGWHRFSCAHLPAHVEGANGFRASNPRDVSIYKDAVAEWARLARIWLDDPDIASVSLTGDWNISFREPWVRLWLEDQLPDELHPNWLDNMPADGTHGGNRVIDMTWTSLTVEGSRLLAGDYPSDHQPFVERLTPKGDPMDRFVSRDEWGATRKRPTVETHPIGRTLGITAHWEGPGMGRFSHDLCARKVRSIERFHEVNRGWAGIAYNLLVCPHGYVFEGRGWGVKSAANGSTQDNEDWYAVCYIGGQGDPFTPEAKAGFLFAFHLLKTYGAAGAKRNGHRDHKATACPGDAIYRWVHSLADGASAPQNKETFTMGQYEDLSKQISAVNATAHRAVSVATYNANLLKAMQTPEEFAEEVAALLEAKVDTPGSLSKADVKAAIAEVLLEGVEPAPDAA